MAVDDILLDTEERMDKTGTTLKQQLVGIRTGRAHSALVDNIKVDYYGAPTPLKQIASISVPEATMLLIKPFDPSSLPEIEKAILKSNMGITPSNDGKLIRLVLPPLSEERRRQLVIQVKDMGEQAKISIRNIRRDANKSVEKEDGLSEDQTYDAKDNIQNLLQTYEKQVQETINEKSKELMEI